MDIYSLKERLIYYRVLNPNVRNKIILDINLKQDLMSYPNYDDLPINEKAAAIILGYIPKCECGNSVKYQGKIKSGINSTPFGGWLEFCSTTCARSSSKTIARRKATNLQRFGVESWAQSTKAKETSSLLWSDKKKDDYNKKRIETSLLKYGVDHYSKTEQYLQKRTNTVLTQTGGKFTNYFQNTDKIIQANNQKYGVDYYTQTVEGKKRLSNNNAMKDPEIALKSLLTKRSKLFSTDFYNVLIQNDMEVFKSFIHQIVSYNSYSHRHQIAKHLSISYSYLNNLMRKNGMNNDYLTIGTSISYKEQAVFEFVSELGVSIKRSDRTILNGKEIDILVESHKLGIEFDGIYYHSVFTGGKDKLYHVNKTNLAEDKGYQLLHIFENEWDDPIKKDIWKSIIKSKLGLITRKIFARKCIIKEISSKESRVFFDNNHLSGFVGASNHVGLFYNDELVSAISYGQSRFDKTEIELYRFASLLDTQVVGGLGKLLKQIPSDNLISFADRRISGIDSVYSKFFKHRKILPASWWGFKSGTSELNHRLSYTKSKVTKILDNKYDNNISCIDNMFNNGYDIIYDCGNYKFYN
jgi:hypothetical protein